jgi:hypothetical protein
MILVQITRFNGGNHFETPNLTQRPGRRDYQASQGFQALMTSGIADLIEVRKVEK